MSSPPAELGAPGLVEVLTEFRDGLRRHEATINRLNVFPVPDGDTGTNMLATLDSVLKSIGALEESPAMAAVASAISHGALMGARGNSGVILCQILRGLAKVAGESEYLDAALLAAGLEEGSVSARAAVLRPVEGTILTVAADAADAAKVAASVVAASSLAVAATAARDAAVTSLAYTPKQLAVLEQAGVVDAGGAGLVCFYEALRAVANDEPMPTDLALPEEVAARIAQGTMSAVVVPVGTCEDAGDLRYEVMYLLDAPDEAIPSFRDAWGAIGDSIVVVGEGGLHNCHIHTNDIGAAIEAALDVGRPREIRVTDLTDQVEEERWVRQASVEPLPTGPAPRTSVVTVGTGEGIQRVFRSLGVSNVVHGGQSMNPSTAEMLEMIEAAPGSEVVVLPNNTNIYPVARQAAELSTKDVRVVATAGVQEGFAALLDYDPQASAEDNAAAMTEAATRVVCGEVTRAVRATTTPAGEVAEGDFIGLSREGIDSVAATLADATIGLLEHLIGSEHEIVTLIEGAGVPAVELRRVTEWMADHYPTVSLEHIRGDQPLYPFLISIE